MKIYLKKIIIISCIFMAIMLIASPSLAATNALNRLNNTANAAGFSTDAMGGSAAEWKLVDFIGAIIRTLLSFIGVLFMVLIIYAGFLWMTARGNESQIEKSKNILKSSLIGLMIVVGAYAIVTVVSALLNNMGFFG